MRKPDPARSEQVPLRDYLDSKVDHLESRIVSNAELAAQRFEDQDRAVLAALAAQEKAVNAALIAAKEAVAAALAAADRAVAKAETADEKRFEAHNGLQAQLEAQTSTFVTRNEVNLQLGAMTARMEALTTQANVSEGRSTGLNLGWTIGVSAFLLLAALVSMVVTLTHH